MLNSLYELKIDGKDVKRFISQLYNMNIYFEEIRYIDKKVYIKVNKYNLDKIYKVKTIYKIEITKVYGLSKIKDIIKKYNIFFIFIIIGIIYINILCNIIFEIEIDTENKYIYELLELELKKEGIKKYSYNKTFKERERILNNILKNNQDTLEWLEIEKIGVKYIIRVEERIIKTKKDKCKNRNIIAKREGIIKSINASSGEIKKSINDYVKKGDIIISGIITKNDEEKNKVCATGKVYAETWYQVNVEVPYNYKEIIYTGKKQKNLIIKIFDKRYSLFDDKDIYTEKEISLKNNIIPLKISYEEQEKIIKIDHIYTEEELDLKALEIAREKLLSTIGKDSSILLEKKLKTIPKNSTIEVVIFFKVKEDITNYQNID